MAQISEAWTKPTSVGTRSTELPHWAVFSSTTGTVFSSFNSLLQSSATIITYDIVMPWRGKPLSDRAKLTWSLGLPCSESGWFNRHSFAISP